MPEAKKSTPSAVRLCLLAAFRASDCDGACLAAFRECGCGGMGAGRAPSPRWVKSAHPSYILVR